MPRWRLVPCLEEHTHAADRAHAPADHSQDPVVQAHRRGPLQGGCSPAGAASLPLAGGRWTTGWWVVCRKKRKAPDASHHLGMVGLSVCGGRVIWSTGEGSLWSHPGRNVHSRWRPVASDQQGKVRSPFTALHPLCDWRRVKVSSGAGCTGVLTGDVPGFGDRYICAGRFIEGTCDFPSPL